jgi:multicomponent Na+:H+ antiporter subunit A
MKGALIYLIVHALYKGTLFMVAGSIDKKTGTRDIDKLGNLARKMPITTVVALLALLSMMGMPPMIGFIGKEVVYEAKMQAPNIHNFIVFAGVVSNVFMVWVSIFIAYRVFFRREYYAPKIPKETSFHFWIGPLILAVGGLLLGIFPEQLGEKLIQPALSAVQSKPLKIKLHLWHGFNQIFLLSLLTLISGIVLFLLRKHILPVLRRVNRVLFSVSFSDLFFNFLDWIIAFSKRNTLYIQHGYHRFYLMILFVAFALLGWNHLIDTQFWLIDLPSLDIPGYTLLISIIMVVATIFTLFSNSRLTAIISMGVVGYGVAMMYAMYSAIDLAITQLLVETLTMVIFVMVVIKLPRFAKLSSKTSKLRDGIIALTVGGFMTGVALRAQEMTPKSTLQEYFLEKGLTEGYGSNIVNVILVDFRALDTLGEVSVLMIAALGIVALLKMDRK